MLPLSVFRPKLLISIPSIVILLQDSIFVILNKAYNIEDLPAPVLPTHPTVSPGFT
jgi:hypothetical protein